MASSSDDSGSSPASADWAPPPEWAGADPSERAPEPLQVPPEWSQPPPTAAPEPTPPAVAAPQWPQQPFPQQPPLPLPPPTFRQQPSEHQGWAAASPQHQQGPYAPSADERSSATMAYVGTVIVGFLTCGLLSWVVPVMLMSGKGKTSPFVRHHALQALNFYLLMFVVGFVVTITVVLIPFVMVASLAGHCVGAMKANQGDWYRIPYNVSWVK